MAEIKVTLASGEDWADFIARTNGRSGFTERVLLEVHQRLLAVEAAGGVARNPGHASVAPAVLTVDELADCLPANAWAGPEGYSRQAFARHLLDHPRIGALLKGEGAPAPRRVVLPEEPPEADVPRSWSRMVNGPQKLAWKKGHAAGWAACRAEVERQQQGGQADG